jgi:hypothetical protein
MSPLCALLLFVPANYRRIYGFLSVHLGPEIDDPLRGDLDTDRPFG